jgi:hypothetical protein
MSKNENVRRGNFYAAYLNPGIVKRFINNSCWAISDTGIRLVEEEIDEKA